MEHFVHLLGTRECLRFLVIGVCLEESAELSALISGEGGGSTSSKTSVSLGGESKWSSYSIKLRSAVSSSKLFRFKSQVSGSVLILLEVSGGISLGFVEFFGLVGKLVEVVVVVEFIIPFLNILSCSLTK